MTMIVSPQGVDNHARTRGGVGVVVSIGEQVDGNERNTQKKKKRKKRQKDKDNVSRLLGDETRATQQSRMTQCTKLTQRIVVVLGSHVTQNDDANL